MIFKSIALLNFLHTCTMTNVTKDSIKQFGAKKDNAKSNVLLFLEIILMGVTKM